MAWNSNQHIVEAFCFFWTHKLSLLVDRINSLVRCWLKCAAAEFKHCKTLINITTHQAPPTTPSNLKTGFHGLLLRFVAMVLPLWFCNDERPQWLFHIPRPLPRMQNRTRLNASGSALKWFRIRQRVRHTKCYFQDGVCNILQWLISASWTILIVRCSLFSMFNRVVNARPNNIIIAILLPQSKIVVI